MAKPKITFKGLKDLSASKRMEAARQEGAASLLDRLTPTEFAQLFPDYWKRGTPDVSGFRLAISRASAKQQASLTEEIQQGIATARKKADDAYEYVKKKLTGGGKPVASLTPEQDEAFKAVQKGAIPASGTQGSIFSRLSKTQLASIGVELTEDDKGNKVYKYSEPGVSKEEAISRLKTSGGGNESSARSNAEKYLGRSMSDTEWSELVRATNAETSHKDQTETTMIMASIINRARNKNTSISSVLREPKQFSSVTGIGRANFEAGPSSGQSKGIFNAAGGLNSVSKSQTDFASANPRAYDGEGGRGEAKIQERYDKGFVKVGGSIFNTKPPENIASSGEPVKPEGPNGTYSDSQIVSMQEQLKSEKNTARRQQLANILQEAQGGGDQPTASVNTAGTDKWDSISPRGSTHWCARGVVHLSKQIFKGNPYFDGASVEGHGNAADYTKGSNFFTNSGMYQRGERISKDMLTPEFLASLPPGTIVAQGGADYASRFGHIQMKVGNKWMSDHTQNKGFYKDNVSGRNYTDFTIMRLTPQGEKSLADSGYLNLSEQDKTKVASVETAPAPPPPQPTMEDIKKEVAVNNAPEGEDKPDAEAKKQEPPKEAPKPKVEPQTATVTKPEPPKPTSQRFKLNQQALIAEIKKIDSRASLPFVSDQMIMDGFRDEVKQYGMTVDDKGVVTVKDMNHPEIKKMQQTMDIKKFATPIEEKKVEPPKPVTPPPEKKVEAPIPPKMEVAKAPEPPKPEPKPEVKPETKPAEPPKEQPKVEPKKTSEVEAPKVKTAASGGSFNVGDQGIEAYPISGIKNDNTVVVNKQQQPLFTMNSKETAMFNPSSGKVDVIPKSANVPPAPDRMEQHVSQLRNEMNSVFSSLDQKLAEPMVSKTPERDDNPNMMLDLLNMTKTPYQNPTFQRAMSRTRMHETGDATNDFHYSAGNKNQA